MSSVVKKRKQEDAQAQAPQDAEEDALAAQAQGLARRCHDRHRYEGPGAIRGFAHVRQRSSGTLQPMTIALKLTHDEPRLVYLALVYHLGRPGSELDPETKQPVEHGLRDVKVALGRRLDARVSDHRARRRAVRSKLLSAIYGCVNELRVYHMRDGAPSTVARFTETASTLFPAIARRSGGGARRSPRR